MMCVLGGGKGVVFCIIVLAGFETIIQKEQ